MKVKLGDVLDGFVALDAFANNFSFTLKLTHDLGQTHKSCRLQAMEYDEAVAIVRKRFTVKNAEGKEVVDPEKLDDFKGEIKDLRSKEVEIHGKPITLEMVRQAMILAHKQQKPEDKDYEPIVQPALFSPLDWLIVAGEDYVKSESATA